MTSPLDTASSLLLWSNILYVVGALLTLGTSAKVLFEKRQMGKGTEVKHSVRNEIAFFASAIVCLAGTCGAIYFGDKVSHLKDDDLAAYEKDADGRILAAQILSLQTANDNLDLQDQLAKLSAGEKSNEEKLSERVVPDPRSLSTLLKKNAATKVGVVAAGTEKESRDLQRQFVNIFTVANIPNDTGTVYGETPNYPTAQIGVHCYFVRDPPNPQFCHTLTTYLTHHGLKADEMQVTNVEWLVHDATVAVVIGPMR